MTAASSGHKLGQIIGDWFEEKVATYLLQRVADELDLYLDHRFKKRACRGKKIIWQDLDGNSVDYDFVLELGGTETCQGIPVAFFETFWRRGSRHSKDKARDDSGKLMPMRSTYPTTRVLGIISAGDFTQPAQELVKTRDIDLFYIPKDEITSAWKKSGLEIDYIDKANESEKQELVKKISSLMNQNMANEIFNNLYPTKRSAIFDNYIKRMKANISAIPIQFEIGTIYICEPVIFSSFDETKKYLEGESLEHNQNKSSKLFNYKVIFNDGSIFERTALTVSDALKLNSSVKKVSEHFLKIQNAEK